MRYYCNGRNILLYFCITSRVCNLKDTTYAIDNDTVVTFAQL